MENRKVLTDTSIVIDYLRNKDKPSSKFIQLFKEFDLCISVISIFELLNGATAKEKHKDIQKLSRNL